MIPNFDGLVSGPENIFWFLFGICSVQVWQVVKCKYLDWKYPGEERHRVKRVNWLMVAMAIVFFISIGVGVQNQKTYNFATQLARETKACQEEFNQALKARSQVTAENDELSQEQRTLVFRWMHDIIFPPPPYDKLSPGDLNRQQWGIDRTIGASRQFERSLKRQDELQAQRDSHPLPDPTCGR